MGLAEVVRRQSKCNLSAIQRAILKGLKKNHINLEAECYQLTKTQVLQFSEHNLNKMFRNNKILTVTIYTWCPNIQIPTAAIWFKQQYWIVIHSVTHYKANFKTRFCYLPYGKEKINFGSFYPSCPDLKASCPPRS